MTESAVREMEIVEGLLLRKQCGGWPWGRVAEAGRGTAQEGKNLQRITGPHETGTAFVPGAFITMGLEMACAQRPPFAG